MWGFYLEGVFIRLGVHRTKNKTVRSIPINQKIIDYLQSLPRPLQGGFVFSKRCFNRKAYNKAVKASNLGDVTLHDLRHCAASYLVMAGVDMRTLAEILGHKTIQMTQRYAHLSPEHLKDAVSKMNHKIFG